jgi:uncharacterized membrane protein YgcG
MKRRIAFLIGLWLVLGSVPVKAQGEQPHFPPLPPSGNYISDELDWLTAEQENSINSTVRSLDQDGVAEIAVVTLDDCGPDKQTFRKSLFDEWGVGHADDNDGLLILACWYGGDPERRSIEQLYGPGLNGILTSEKTDRLAQTVFVPDFQSGKPGDGLVAMVTSYNILLRVPQQSESRSIFDPVIDFFKGLHEIYKLGLILLLILGFQAILGRIMPESWREHWRERDGDGSDGDSFGGGRSDGGGGNSTRF